MKIFNKKYFTSFHVNMEDYMFTKNQDNTKNTEKHKYIIWDGVIGVQAF